MFSRVYNPLPMALPPVYELEVVIQNRDDDYLFTFDDFINFSHDLNLLYEFTRLVFDSKYEGYKFSAASLRSDPWSVSREDRLNLYRITQESPITMLLLLGAMPSTATAIWVLTQIIDKIYNFRLDHQIRMLQRDKLMQELTTTPVPAPFPDERTVQRQIGSRRATRYIRDLEEKIAASPIRILQFEVKTHYDDFPEEFRIRRMEKNPQQENEQ
jgi:hypothetical protein